MEESSLPTFYTHTHTRKFLPANSSRRKKDFFLPGTNGTRSHHSRSVRKVGRAIFVGMVGDPAWRRVSVKKLNKRERERERSLINRRSAASDFQVTQTHRPRGCIEWSGWRRFKRTETVRAQTNILISFEPSLIDYVIQSSARGRGEGRGGGGDG